MKIHGFYMGKGSIPFLTWMPLKKSWYQCSGHCQFLPNSLEIGWPFSWCRPTASLTCIPATSLPPLMTRIRFTMISWQESEKNVIKHKFKDTTFSTRTPANNLGHFIIMTHTNSGYLQYSQVNTNVRKPSFLDCTPVKNHMGSTVAGKTMTNTYIPMIS